MKENLFEVFGQKTEKGRSKYLSFGVCKESELTEKLKRLRIEKPEWKFSSKSARVK